MSECPEIHTLIPGDHFTSVRSEVNGTQSTFLISGDHSTSVRLKVSGIRNYL